MIKASETNGISLYQENHKNFINILSNILNNKDISQDFKNKYTPILDMLKKVNRPGLLNGKNGILDYMFRSYLRDKSEQFSLTYLKDETTYINRLKKKSPFINNLSDKELTTLLDFLDPINSRKNIEELKENLQNEISIENSELLLSPLEEIGITIQSFISGMNENSIRSGKNLYNNIYGMFNNLLESAKKNSVTSNYIEKRFTQAEDGLGTHFNGTVSGLLSGYFSKAAEDPQLLKAGKTYFTVLKNIDDILTSQVKVDDITKEITGIPEITFTEAELEQLKFYIKHGNSVIDTTSALEHYSKTSPEHYSGFKYVNLLTVTNDSIVDLLTRKFNEINNLDKDAKRAISITTTPLPLLLINANGGKAISTPLKRTNKDFNKTHALLSYLINEILFKKVKINAPNARSLGEINNDYASYYQNSNPAISGVVDNFDEIIDVIKTETRKNDLLQYDLDNDGHFSEGERKRKANATWSGILSSIFTFGLNTTWETQQQVYRETGNYGHSVKKRVRSIWKTITSGFL